MGIVYKARQLSLNRPVALKVIKASRFPSTDEVRRFQNESQAGARLDHPDIVQVIELGPYEDQHYFSMKLIDGDSLDNRSNEYLADPPRAVEIPKPGAYLSQSHQNLCCYFVLLLLRIHGPHGREFKNANPRVGPTRECLSKSRPQVIEAADRFAINFR
jgi:serine/threonine protein kinase